MTAPEEQPRELLHSTEGSARPPLMTWGRPRLRNAITDLLPGGPSSRVSDRQAAAKPCFSAACDNRIETSKEEAMDTHPWTMYEVARLRDEERHRRARAAMRALEVREAGTNPRGTNRWLERVWHLRRPTARTPARVGSPLRRAGT